MTCRSCYWTLGPASAGSLRCRLMLFHHAPGCTDGAVGAIASAAETWSNVPVVAAAEGLVLEL